VKTVKQRVVLEILLDAGIRAFKCATVRELTAILEAGRSLGCEADLDVLLAYPLRGPALGVFIEAQDDSPARLRTLADDPAHLTTLLGWLPPAAVLLDIDVGMGRTGSAMAEWSAFAADRAEQVPFAELGGLHAYEGHVRDATDPALPAIYESLARFATAHLRHREQLVVTSGTPACLVAAADPHLAAGPFQHQVSPGTLVLSDLRSAPIARALGVRPAAFVASTVVHRGRGRCTLDAGSKALGADGPGPHAEPFPPLPIEIATPSEEHLPVRATGATEDAPLPAAGTLVLLVPSHVCTTVNLHDRAVWYAGGRIVGDGPIDARGHDLWRPSTSPSQ
jgi:D-serine deaminase-like pyridoxal phosphate-dependent protein